MNKKPPPPADPPPDERIPIGPTDV